MKLRGRTLQRFVVFLAVVAGMLVYVALQWSPSGRRAAGPGSAPPPVSLQQAGSGSSGAAGPESALPPEAQAGEAARQGTLPPASPPAAGSDYFTTARLDRERAQSEEIDLLKSLAGDPQAAGSARQAAGRKLIAVAARIRHEARAEDLLKAKGYREALVFLDSAGATAVVRAASLSETDVARIAETVSGATGVPSSRINILAEE